MPPQVLIDTSIVQLQRLSASLAYALGELRAASRASTLEARACKEILLSITVLIPKLQAARYVVGETDGASEPSETGRCAACQDN